MALMSKAALAMWWDVAPADRPGFEHWHSSEHFAERLAVPGFLRGTRWVAVSGEPYYFVMYELTGLDVLSSEPYRERVNHPTLWTTQTMARFRNMVRSQCVLQGSEGGGIAQAMLTVRFSPQAGQETRLREWIVQHLLPGLVAKAGVTGAHLIENAVPAVPLDQQTAEQKLRGGDTVADWILLVSGYDAAGLTSLMQNELQDSVLAHHGAAAGRLAGMYRLADSMSKDQQFQPPAVRPI
jgi:hypothetical protein